MKDRLQNKIGISNNIPEGWSGSSLLELLARKTDDRLPKMLKNISWGQLNEQFSYYVLDRGFKINFLIYSLKVRGYLGIDFMLYPKEEQKWDYYYEKKQKILDLEQSGVYEILNVKRMGIFLVKPETPECLVEKPLRFQQDDKIFEFINSLENSKTFLAPTGAVDLRQKFKDLELPPDWSKNSLLARETNWMETTLIC